MNHGGPTLAFVPVTASEISGKNVPQKITKHMPTSTRLLSRKIASRLSSESSLWVERRLSRRETTRATEPSVHSAMKPTKGTPSVESPKAWIDCRIPERTRNVPTRARMKAPMTSETFHMRSIPRRSWTIPECRKAVANSHGISEAFSTGSQAQ